MGATLVGLDRQLHELCGGGFQFADRALTAEADTKIDGGSGINFGVGFGA